MTLEELIEKLQQLHSSARFAGKIIVVRGDTSFSIVDVRYEAGSPAKAARVIIEVSDV